MDGTTRSSHEGMTGEVIFMVLAYLKRILSVRNLCVYKAHLNCAGGSLCPHLEEQAPHFLNLKHGDSIASAGLAHQAIEALRVSGEAGASRNLSQQSA